MLNLYFQEKTEPKAESFVYNMDNFPTFLENIHSTFLKQMKTWKKYISVYFGVPKRGIHSVRLWDIAVLDVLGAIVLALWIHLLTGYYLGRSILLVFVFGQCVHKLLGVRTTFTKWFDKKYEMVRQKIRNPLEFFQEKPLSPKGASVRVNDEGEA